jgi:hypothetical protein
MVCASLERKKPQTFVPTAPSEITGAPPPDIEQMDGPALLAEQAAFNKKTDFELSTDPDAWGPLQIIANGKASLIPARTAKESFDTLPTDDSHASKVMRAASAYAKASKDWAQNLARVEKIKSELLKAEALLHEALVAKETSEGDLKTLVAG